MQRLPVRDDNLRLILSKGHDEWLTREIRDRYIAAAVVVMLLVGSLVAGKIFIWTEPAPSNVAYVQNGSDAAIQEIEAEGYKVALGKPAEQPSESKGALLLLELLLIFAGVAVAVAAPLVLIKLGLEIRKLRRWRVEHAAFLDSYNRRTNEGT